MAVPRALGKYEILDLLGTGGMGTVYRARDLVLERIVAVKLLNRERIAAPGSDDAWARFLNEARAVARLNHPAIVSVYDFSDSDPAGAFFAMEYVDGCTIEDFVHQRTDGRLARALDLMGQLLSGLAYAHGQGVIHRDIKPSNLLVTRDGRLKITDFGIAKVGSLKQTLTGVMIGTPAYMAPERYTGGCIDHRCDVYSAGVLLFELLTGRRPFSGALTEVMYKICHVMPDAVSSIEPTLPALLDIVLAKALAKKPDGRFQTADEFAAALRGVGETLGLPARHEALAGVSVRSAATAGAGPVATELVSTRANRSQPGSAATGTPPGWSTEQLAEIEGQLTPILGPMARILVRRAAALTCDRERLVEELAGQLRGDEERRRFLGSVPLAARPPEGAPRAPTRPDGAIAPATLDRTAKILMRYIGPIGAVLVKKTALAAQDESDLYTRLAERISDVRERARFMAELTGPLS